MGRPHFPRTLMEFQQRFATDEGCRFNRRRTPMAAFQPLVGLTAQHQPTTYEILYAGESTG